MFSVSLIKHFKTFPVCPGDPLPSLVEGSKPQIDKIIQAWENNRWFLLCRELQVIINDNSIITSTWDDSNVNSKIIIIYIF